MEKFQKLICIKTGSEYLYKGFEDFHCREGMLKLSDLQDEKKSIIFANTNYEFFKFPANLYDKQIKIKKITQGILPKDLGFISARCGLNKKSVILEAGSGCGSSATFFSNIVKQVFSCDVEKKNLEVAIKNSKTQEIENIEFAHKKIEDYIKDFEKKFFDILFLDMLNSSQILKKNLAQIKNGGMIVFYLPSVTQIIEVVNSVYKNKKNII